MILIENTFDNDTHDFRTHLKKLKAEYGRIKKMGIRRIEMLKRAFSPTIVELQQLTNLITGNIQKYLFCFYKN